MMIDKIKIDNRTISFNNNFNLIIGENGCGKTRLLNSLFVGLMGSNNESIVVSLSNPAEKHSSIVVYESFYRLYHHKSS